jgi:CDP-6-deoxy-D-xylo-4-hexulose-3-dehydrase
VREVNDADVRGQWQRENPALNPDFIFAFPAYNLRNTEVGAIIGRSQLKRLDANVELRTRNLHRFLQRIDNKRYQTDFLLEGSSNYAFNLILNDADPVFVERLMAAMRESGIEFRRGSAGGGNQTRQPYLRGIVPNDHHLQFPHCEHVHFYGFYIGNFPDLRADEIDSICKVVNAV